MSSKTVGEPLSWYLKGSLFPLLLPQCPVVMISDVSLIQCQELWSTSFSAPCLFPYVWTTCSPTLLLVLHLQMDILASIPSIFITLIVVKARASQSCAFSGGSSPSSGISINYTREDMFWTHFSLVLLQFVKLFCIHHHEEFLCQHLLKDSNKRCVHMFVLCCNTVDLDIVCTSSNFVTSALNSLPLSHWNISMVISEGYL